ncbi:MAG: hypothetical protein QM803_00965 [Rhodocyclaceae bacterium]
MSGAFVIDYEVETVVGQSYEVVIGAGGRGRGELTDTYSTRGGDTLFGNLLTLAGGGTYDRGPGADTQVFWRGGNRQLIAPFGTRGSPAVSGGSSDRNGLPGMLVARW